MSKGELLSGDIFDTEHIRNLGARAEILPDDESIQQVGVILYNGLYRVFSTRPHTTTPLRLGWTPALAEALLVQGKRVSGTLPDIGPRLPRNAEFGQAFIALKPYLKQRLGDTPAGTREEQAFNGLLIEGYATTAENSHAMTYLASHALDFELRTSLEQVETLVGAAETHSIQG